VRGTVLLLERRVIGGVASAWRQGTDATGRKAASGAANKKRGTIRDQLWYAGGRDTTSAAARVDDQDSTAE